jgi:putative membrane protein
MQSTAPQRPPRTLKDYFSIVLRGILMGSADIVPGVSGGTMAFILGIYEELIDSIRTVGQPEFIRAVLRFRLKEVFEILNWRFLLALATGIFIAILTLAKVLESLLENQPVYLWSFFFGLVLASVLVVSKRIPNWNMPLVATLAIGAIGAYILVGLVPAQTPTAWWFIILSGAVASCAMILPGISGAFLLVLLGKYQYVLSAVNDRDIVTVALVGIGAVLGLVTFAQVLGWLFKTHHDLTVAALMGLMVGSLRKIWPWKEEVDWLRDAAGQIILNSDGHQIVVKELNILPDFGSSAGLTQFGIAVALALLGFVVVIAIDRLAAAQEN